MNDEASLISDVAGQALSPLAREDNDPDGATAMAVWRSLVSDGWLDIGFGQPGRVSLREPLIFAEQIGRLGVSVPFSLASTVRLLDERLAHASGGQEDYYGGDRSTRIGVVFLSDEPKPGLEVDLAWDAYVTQPIYAVSSGRGVWSSDFERIPESRSANLASEPIGRVRLRDVQKVSGEELAVQATTYACVLMSAQLAGLAKSMSHEATVHSVSREQFGRPIYKFQAVGQLVAKIAARTVLCDASVDAVRDRQIAEFQDNASTELYLRSLGAFQLCASHASAAARDAHQVLGAIGTTREHPLHRFSTRAWVWRDSPIAEHNSLQQLWDAASSLSEEDLWNALAPATAP